MCVSPAIETLPANNNVRRDGVRQWDVDLLHERVLHHVTVRLVPQHTGGLATVVCHRSEEQVRVGGAADRRH